MGTRFLEHQSTHTAYEHCVSLVHMMGADAYGYPPELRQKSN